MEAKLEFDIAIIGGGLAGASLASALADKSYKVAVIEPFAFDASSQPSYDERTIALTYSSKHIFTQLGVWDETVEKEACALKSIHISNKGHFGLARLSHQDSGTPALGYVVPTRVLGKALTAKISSASNIKFYCPYEAQKVKLKVKHAQISLKSVDQINSNKKISAKLVVVADGGRSRIINDLGFTRERKSYRQSALLSIVRSNIPHRHKAYERFVENGPLALLPMNDQRFAVVWTLAPDELERVSSLDDKEYIKALQNVFGMRAGIFSHPSPRKAYSLEKSSIKAPYLNRVVALGNAAHTVHPVAGQGFNLGLRDVAALAEQLLESDTLAEDIGSLKFLQRYSNGREADSQRVGQFTDGLLMIFTHSSPYIKIGRNIGLAVVEHLPFVKRALLKRTMGMGKNQPRLARGLKIR